MTGQAAPVRLLVHMQALPGAREQMRTTYQTLSASVRDEPGCQEFALYQSIERSDDFVLLERWADEASLRAHGQLLRQRGLALDSLRRIVRTERYDG